jgi:hypothetical protein
VTAIDPIAPAGQPLDLKAVMSEPAAASARFAKEPANRSGFGFADFIDVINPLQHIPGVAELYRSVTNDRISDEARRSGNALYGFALGGPIGLGAMLAYTALGDRLNDGEVSVTADVAGGAETVSGAGAQPVEIPVPAPKPDTNPASGTDRDLQNAVLGETVAAAGRTQEETPPTGQAVGSAAVPAETLPSGGPAMWNREPGRNSAAGGLASSVAYVADHVRSGLQVPVLPGEEGLGRLATHKSNHLPLDVLKTLQERHADRTASQRP